MRAVLIEQFGRPPRVADVDEPSCGPDQVVLTVAATGLCRSDWHAWQGHDPDVALPHVPGHEIAGTIAQVGERVSGWSIGQRVTVPFVCACGQCAQCRSGNAQTCEHQQQPGFTYWGSFAERVVVPNAAINLVALPDGLEFSAAATLGCRMATAYRAVRDVGAVQRGQWLAVFGCGGVGLSAVMIAASIGARVIAVDQSEQALVLARDQGAEITICAAGTHAAELIRSHVPEGVDATMDAVGSDGVLSTALTVLRPRGRHVQVGLLPQVSGVHLGVLIGRELQVLGSHGMAAAGYARMLSDVAAGIIRPAELVTREIALAEVPQALQDMTLNTRPGVTVIRPQWRWP